MKQIKIKDPKNARLDTILSNKDAKFLDNCMNNTWDCASRITHCA